MSTSKIELGKKGELLVAHYLQQQGFSIITHNYRCRSGEIDIIAEKATLRVFVEVKLRQSSYFALSEVITPSKQKKIITTARFYNSRQQDDYSNLIYRFDVALLEPDNNDYTITYIPNAFAPGDNHEASFSF